LARRRGTGGGMIAASWTIAVTPPPPPPPPSHDRASISRRAPRHPTSTTPPPRAAAPTPCTTKARRRWRRRRRPCLACPWDRSTPAQPRPRSRGYDVSGIGTHMGANQGPHHEKGRHVVSRAQGGRCTSGEQRGRDIRESTRDGPVKRRQAVVSGCVVEVRTSRDEQAYHVVVAVGGSVAQR